VDVIVKRKLAFLFVIALGAPLLLEISLRVHPLDEQLIQSLLYYQGSDVSIHRPLEDSELLYGLKPNAQYNEFEMMAPWQIREQQSFLSDYFYPLNEGERPYCREREHPRLITTVNNLGFRDRWREPAKAPGVFRIVVLGGSNTYGAEVSDDDTYPILLERQLNRLAPGRFEVWNAGISAYVLSQKVRLARQILERYAPDLLIFQHYNTGRRAFLEEHFDFSHLRRNPALAEETLGPLPLGSRSIGRALFNGSALWRTATLAYKAAHGEPQPTQCEDCPTEIANQQRFLAFARQVKDRVELAVMPFQETQIQWLTGSGVKVINLFGEAERRGVLDEDFMDVHPPAEVYARYAEIMEAELNRLGLLPEVISMP